MNIFLPVMRSANLLSYPKHADGGRARYLPIAEALSGRYLFDAHTAAYSVPAIERRLAGTAPETLPWGVPMVAAMFDIDGADHKAPESWWAEERPKIERVRSDMSLFGYRTRGGYRLVGILPEPFMITSKADAEAWKHRYFAWLAYLKRVCGIVADPSCADWPRLYRLPHATRDEGGKPEELETIGDVEAIGTWEPALTAEDMAVAPTLARRTVPGKASRRAVTFGSGAGVLYHLFMARGWLGDRIEPGKWAVACPWESSHTKGSAFDTSTILWAPGSGDEYGWLHCSHGHCSDREIRDVLALFSQSEIDAASQCDILCLPGGLRVRLKGGAR